MKCCECDFTAELDKGSKILVCLINGQACEREHECHMPSVDDKLMCCRNNPSAKVFNKNTDMVRAALNLMKDYNMEAQEAMDTINILYGRYE